MTIHGTLTGTVHGKSVNLARTARMVGDVTHETLTVEAGARMKRVPPDDELECGF